MSTKSADESPDYSARRDRAAIAAQACQTCRSRKSKCDEQRPKCGLCTRLGVECVYREPQPTKKDKTLVHILSVLERVEAKVDRLDPQFRSQSASAFDPSVISPPPPSGEPIDVDTVQLDRRRQSQTFPPIELVNADTHLTAAHRILLWPSVYMLLTNTRTPAVRDLHHIMQDGSAWFSHLELQKHPYPLPTHTTSLHPTNSSHPPHCFSLGYAGLGGDDIRQLVDAYFEVYNVLHPILDRDHFYSTFVNPVLHGGYENGNAPTCLVMLVLALGRMAIDGASGPPLQNATTSRTGIRGGAVETPPGLDLFNEARRRLGFVMHDCGLENVRIYLLQATYLEACARHMDYWRSCASASMAFQVYIRCQPVDWSSVEADMIKRVYWSCMLHEDLYHLELDLPRTGIYALEDKIPLPYFTEVRSMLNVDAQEVSHSHYHFLAMIALRRLLARIHEALHSESVTPGEGSESDTHVPIHLIKELARQLESWRTFLPRALQWSDDDAHSYPNIDPLMRDPPGPLFTPESMSPAGTAPVMARSVTPSGGSDSSSNNNPLHGHTHGQYQIAPQNLPPLAAKPNAPPSRYRFNLDIVTGHLRTRFYYARYLVYRPFVFKALHFPETMTSEDAEYCALAIQSACVWPLAMAPCRDKKRLIPSLFTWTQSFIGILLLLRAADESDHVRRICEERVSRRDMNLTVGLLLDWINDMRAIDGVAEWAWGILEPLFAGYR